MSDEVEHYLGAYHQKRCTTTRLENWGPNPPRAFAK